jgi:hypothetical protein
MLHIVKTFIKVGIIMMLAFEIFKQVISIAIYYFIFLLAIHMVLEFMTASFPKKLSDQVVKRYLFFIRLIPISRSSGLWNTIHSGYKWVEASNKVHADLKNKLRMLLIKKGIEITNVKILRKNRFSKKKYHKLLY